MPIYEYQCQQCNETLEVIQTIRDAKITECKKCGGVLEKLVSAAMFQFKGGGWYKDLYASSKPETADKESNTKAVSKDSTSEASSPQSDGKTSSPQASKTVSSKDSGTKGS